MQKKLFFTILSFEVLVHMFLVPVVFCEESVRNGPSEVPKDDSEMNVSRPLPGEEVTTRDGKRMRVWTTEGNISVRKPPTPGQDEGSGVNIDKIEVHVDAPNAKEGSMGQER